VQKADQRRPTPEQILKQVEAEERLETRGKLKIFLGYAGGVGKSYRMFDEARRRKERGEDVIVGAAQPEVPPEIDELFRCFESIPPRADLGFPAIDVAAILNRRPQVCVVDGLAYDNPAGARNAHRWQDVRELLNAGISILTSINLQFVRDRQPQVESIRRKIVKESVPEAFIKTADEIEIVDAPPEYCVTRSRQEGSNAVDAEELGRQLSELREIALLLAAEVVDYQLEEYLRRRGIEHHYGTWERVLVCITPRSSARVMIYRGRRQADRFHGELHVMYVEQEEMSLADQSRIREYLSYAKELQANIEVVRADDPVRAILRFAEEHGITQIFVGHSRRRGWMDRLRPNPVERLILEAEGMDIRIFPNTEPLR
jgi:two-component system, OmpR family, sensor histidine kinase KdpD